MKTKRTLAEFKPLNAAESQILAEIDTGEDIELGDGRLPDEDAGPDRIVRAEFIRYLALGGCDDCKTHEKGLRIFGVLICEVLDLEDCDIGLSIGLCNCRFLKEPVMMGAKLETLNLSGSTFLNGLTADRLAAKGSVFLRRVTVQGPVRLLRAKLGGELSCIGAKFIAAKNTDGKKTKYAFSADGLDVKGTLFFLRRCAGRGACFVGGGLGWNTK